MKEFLTNKFYRVVLLVEVFLIILSVANWFKPLAEYRYGYEQFEYNYGKIVDGLGVFAEGSDVTDEPFICGPLFNIEEGIYNITIDYETKDGDNYIDIAGYNHNFNSLLMDDFKLSSKKTSQEITIWTNKNVRGFGVNVYMGDESTLLVKEIQVEEDFSGRLYETSKLLIWITLLNIVLWIGLLSVKGRINKEKINEFLVIAGIIVFASVPLFATFLTEGDDLYFHLLRIEGIKDGLLAGQFPVRIHPTQFNGYGYANSIFYGEILLYIPAVLRLIGFPLQTSYKIFLFLINVATALIAYKSFKEIFRDKKTAFICCAVFVLAPYRLTNIYVRSAVGEYCAMMFWPLIACGLFKLFTVDVEHKEYKNIWLWLVAGYTGLIGTHMLSCAMGAVASIVVCLIFFKRLFRKNTILELVKFFVTTVIINAFFLVPMLDFMMRGGTMITDLGSMQTNTLITTGIQGNGIYPAQLFNLFVNGSGMAYGHGVDAYKVLGMYNEMGTTVGLPLIAAIIVFVYMCIVSYNEVKKEKYFVPAFIMSVAGIMALYMSTVYFPWDVLCRNLGSIIFNLQFPWRLLSVSTIFLTIVLGCVLLMARDMWGARYWQIIVVVVISLNVITSGYMIYDRLNTSKGIYCYDATSIADRGSGSLEEYMLSGTKTEYLNSYEPLVSKNVSYSNYEKKYTNISLYAKENKGKSGEIVVPLLAYTGYVARDEAGNDLKLGKDSNNVLTVILPANFDGKIFIEYLGLWYWRFADIISVLGVFILILTRVKILKKMPKYDKSKR